MQIQRLTSPLAALAFTVLVACAPVGAQEAPARVAPQVTRLTLEMGGQSIEVLAHIYKPPGPGPFPLVIHSHGRAVKAADRAALEYPVAVGHGNYWLRKGVAVVAPVRPGYGETGGPDVEDSGARWSGDQCRGRPQFTRIALTARRTVQATHQWALRQPWVRKDRILLQGQSVGGLTAVAAAALNLPGVVAAVNFAGGTGGNPVVSPGESCQPDLLTETWRQFGQQTRVPSLWLYAENDQYWGPTMPREWHAAYRTGGSDSTLVMTRPLEGRDGHQLLLHGGRLWSVPLDAFIQRVGLLAP